MPDENILGRKRSRSSLSEIIPLVKKRKVSSCSSSSEEDDVFANSSTAPNQVQLLNVSSSSENDSESESELPSATPGPSTQEEPHTSASNTQLDLSNRSTVILSDNSQPSGKHTFTGFYYCYNKNIITNFTV